MPVTERVRTGGDHFVMEEGASGKLHFRLSRFGNTCESCRWRRWVASSWLESGIQGMMVQSSVVSKAIGS